MKVTAGDAENVSQEGILKTQREEKYESQT